jgi:hypothetical protein
MLFQVGCGRYVFFWVDRTTHAARSPLGASGSGPSVLGRTGLHPYQLDRDEVLGDGELVKVGEGGC